MGFVLLAILLAVILACVLISKFGGFSMFDHDVETVTTTTTTYQDEPMIAGDLQRRREGIQFFVIDPADQQKTWINDRDDLYEDANGRVWRLV